MTDFRVIAACCLLASGAVAEELKDTDFHTFPAAQAELGRLLFYDKVISGNRNIACATCHHHDLASADGLSLGIGEGGVGLGPDRTPGSGMQAIEERIPRSAPALWNLGHKSVEVLFHDGRLSVSDTFASGFASPAKADLPEGLQTILAAQALFPMSSGAEMAGHPTENEVAAGFKQGFPQGWAAVTNRVRAVDGYLPLFQAAYNHVARPDDIGIVEIGNAIGAFIAMEWRNHDSPYDQWLADGTPLPEAAEAGRQLFFGEAGCAGCHSGDLFTDQSHHAIGLPQFGPGKPEHGELSLRDVGRMKVTKNPDDMYRFRTLPLRNVALTAPYGHNGAWPTLPEMIRHMADPAAMRASWQPGHADLPDVPWLRPVDFAVMYETTEMLVQASVLDVQPVALSDVQVSQIEAFLHSLTGATADTRPLGRPDQVPSGLPVD